jgi:hypothetical protein
MRAWLGETPSGRSTARDFLERQKAVAVFAVVDKAGFQRGLDARDDGLVDVALALLAPFDFDFVVEEFLSVDDGQAALFGLRGVDQHPLHDAFPFRGGGSGAGNRGCMRPATQKSKQQLARAWSAAQSQRCLD